jgi:hypothetical protein
MLTINGLYGNRDKIAVMAGGVQLKYILNVLQAAKLTLFLQKKINTENSNGKHRLAQWDAPIVYETPDMGPAEPPNLVQAVDNSSYKTCVTLVLSPICKVGVPINGDGQICPSLPYWI